MTETNITAVARRLVEIDNELADLGLRVDELKRERIDVEDELLRLFETAGVQNLRIDDRTVYLQRQLFASILSERHDDAITRLRELGLGDLVKETVNSQSLSAIVREAERDGRELDPQLAECLNVSEVYRVRTRR